MSGRASQRVRGSAYAAAGAFAYGVTIAVGRSLGRAGFSSSSALGLRFGVAGAVLLAVLAAGRRPLLPAHGERARVFLLGAVGYAVESTFFYLGLTEGTAAAVALLFYSYPAVVTVAEVVLTGRPPPRRVVGAIVLSAAGTGLIALAGGDVDISGAGVALSLASAVMFAAYLLCSERLVYRTDSLTAGAWVAVGAAAALLGRGLATGTLAAPSGYWAQMALYGTATGAAFALLFAAVRRLGSSRTGVVMTLEALFGILLAAAFLGEGIGWIEAAGGVAILGAATIIGLSPEREPDEPALESSP